MTFRVMGIDPGLTRCGLAVVDIEPNRRSTLVAVGVVGTDAGQGLDQRLLVIAEAVDSWLDLHEPQALAVERVFSGTNISTVMGTAQATGAVIVSAARRGIPVALHTPTEVKAAVTGNGQADKVAVTKMVTKILRLDTPPRPADAADALALAITHAWRRGVGTQAAAATASITGGLVTPAQRLWAEAEARARRR
ncbi:crossover junction endodeoxyribonuclease RuvC [Arthrobacter pityocampae]|uniref:Crossover junction endodeoxyribonuclease RuvC n=1 Tax=Arthrobacter pityocampae TaxID=547334 RepID=A0A2S5IZS6_9MICC|nr:crossover junction endodeoxyribonuclease RuvC [Arthrobacter pityocampae]PPB50096.1 crossover junction endodeoxyribonuclease RuvC [Arthrobacter pityocampae]